MAFKGTAGKSSTGASMSKYDVEVEGRLQALEKAVKELQNHSHESSSAVDAEALHQIKNEIFEARQGMAGADSVNTRIDSLVTQIKKKINSDIDA